VADRLGAVPWLLAVAGILVPLVGGDFVTWPFAVVWAVVLGAVWAFGRLPDERRERMILGIAALPMLLLLGWEGGWYFIPAVLAWLALQVARGGSTVGA
jgi:hypothetical protein